ncbi:MAG: (2Fe-2S) ferredoxin domain-containing protein [Phormidesmis sp.]
MTHPSFARFCCSGRFLSFAPGEKSPRQNLWLQVAQADLDLEVEVPDEKLQIKLSKALRQMMVGYLEPQDWVSVAGDCRLDPRSGETVWKAREIVKLSPRQIEDVLLNAIAQNAITQPDSRPPQRDSPQDLVKSVKPARVLICQEASCRRRGSLAVSRAMAGVIAAMAGDRTATSTDSPKLTIRATGCMKQCKAGPNVRLIPSGQSGKSYQGVTPQAARSLIQQVLSADRPPFKKRLGDVVAQDLLKCE